MKLWYSRKWIILQPFKIIKWKKIYENEVYNLSKLLIEKSDNVSNIQN